MIPDGGGDHGGHADPFLTAHSSFARTSPSCSIVVKSSDFETVGKRTRCAIICCVVSSSREVEAKSASSTRVFPSCLICSDGVSADGHFIS